MTTQAYTPRQTFGLGAQAHSAGSRMEARSPDRFSSRVLVVDDDPALLQLIAATLRDEGFEVLAASNGRDALRLVERGEVAAIVLDLEMPVMDGRSFFQELRSRGDRTPVMLLSANQSRAARRELGADAALEKPFEPELLTLQLRRLIEGTY